MDNSGEDRMFADVTVPRGLLGLDDYAPLVTAISEDVGPEDCQVEAMLFTSAVSGSWPTGWNDTGYVSEIAVSARRRLALHVLKIQHRLMRIGFAHVEAGILDDASPLRSVRAHMEAISMIHEHLVRLVDTGRLH